MTTAQDILNHNWPLSLFKDVDGEPFSGGCPCAHLEGEGFIVGVHCWRGGCDHCRGSGVHITGDLDPTILAQIGIHVILNNGWTDHTDWSLIVNGVETEISPRQP